MISYAPLWQMMNDTNSTTYTLRHKVHLSSSTVSRLQKNQSVSTNTIILLCEFFNCQPNDIMLYIGQ